MSLLRASQRFASRGLQRQFSSPRQIKGKYDNDEWILFPRQIEGNDVLVNWSLIESGVANAGLAYRNFPTARLVKRIGTKGGASSAIDMSKFKPGSAAKFLEAGDNITHGQFDDHLSLTQDYLSNGEDLFVEDASIGSHHSFRLGVRVITHSPEIALAYRTLLFRIPPQIVNQYAGRKGWNMHPRWVDHEDHFHWTGTQFADNDNSKPLQGQRPIVVLVGEKGEDVITQFVQFKGEIVGANILVSEQSSPMAVVSAIGSAGSVIYNNENNGAVAVNSASFVKDGKSFVVINANDEAIAAATKAGATLYGGHYNLLSARGVAAVFNGLISGASSGTAVASNPLSVGNSIIAGINPDNLTFPPSKVIFYDPAGSGKFSTKEEAALTLTNETDTKKEMLIRTMLEQVAIGHATKPAQIASLIN